MTFADISGQESVVAASVIGPALLGSFGIIRILTNMEYLVADIDGDMEATNYGTAIQGIPFGFLKLIFAAPCQVVHSILNSVRFRSLGTYWKAVILRYACLI